MKYRSLDIVFLLSFPLIYFSLPIVFNFLSKLLRKYGVRELSDTDVEKIKAMTFPTWYKYVDFLYLSSVILIWLGTWFVSVLYFPILQRTIFGQPGMIFFRGDGGPSIMILLFFLLLMVFSLGGFLVSVFFPKYTLYSYNRYFRAGLTEGIYRIDFPIDIFTKVIIWTFIIFVPLLFLSLHNFVCITNNKLTINSFFSIVDKRYDWNDIKSAGFYGSNPYISRNNPPQPYLDIMLYNAKTISIKMRGPKVKDEDVVNLAKAIKNRNIPLIVKKDASFDKELSKLFDKVREISD